MAVNAVVVHQIPGRVRLRIADKRGDAAYFANLSERMERLENVIGTKANPLTGSIALRFAGGLDEVLRHAKEQGLLSIVDGSRANGHAAMDNGWMRPAGLSQASHAQPVNLVSGREINRDFMMGSMLLLAGLAQGLKGNWFPPALSVLWYAREAFNLAGKRRQAQAG